jgi:predicted  nucleic acid-binding Zn-ribbon protein
MGEETVTEEVKQMDVTIGETVHVVEERVAAYITALEKDFEAMKTHALELEGQVGELPQGAHPDELKPRDATWLKERANWQAEVDSAKAYSKDLKEDFDQFKADVTKRWDAEIAKLGAGGKRLKGIAKEDLKKAIEEFRAALQSSSTTVHELIDKLLKHLGLEK